MPIWGGDQILAKARAIENQVYFVAWVVVTSLYHGSPW